jgi:hypothetical protein
MEDSHKKAQIPMTNQLLLAIDKSEVNASHRESICSLSSPPNLTFVSMYRDKAFKL